MTDMDWLKSLIKLVEESEIDLLEIEGLVAEGADVPTRVRIQKSPRVAAAAVAAPGASAPVSEVAVEAAPDSSDGRFDVSSPMVGTFYSRPSPESDPFVSVGDRVEAGQTLCILEAMKLMNELESEVDGVVREILVEDAEPVEFGQLLFRIEPA